MQVKVKFIQWFLLPLIFLTLALSLVGCNKTKALVAEVYTDKGEAYKTAREYPALLIPRDIKKDTCADTYRIPGEFPKEMKENV